MTFTKGTELINMRILGIVASLIEFSLNVFMNLLNSVKFILIL